MEEHRDPESNLYEEWRLAFDLPEGGPKPSKLADELRYRLPQNFNVHRKGRRGIRVYAGTRAEMDRALDLIGNRLVTHHVQAAILLSRWNPGAERWQDPSLPVERLQAVLPDPWADVDEMAWEVRLKFESDWESDRIVHALREEGAAVLDGWKRCLVALPDETTARQRADELRLEAPRAEIEVRPLSRFRKWQMRQRLYGNYAVDPDGSRHI